jgi:hypothetical protein
MYELCDEITPFAIASLFLSSFGFTIHKNLFNTPHELHRAAGRRESTTNSQFGDLLRWPSRFLEHHVTLYKEKTSLSRDKGYCAAINTRCIRSCLRWK